jgi:hypothetical protein
VVKGETQLYLEPRCKLTTYINDVTVIETPAIVTAILPPSVNDKMKASENYHS